jgi:hypothetical protein
MMPRSGVTTSEAMEQQTLGCMLMIEFVESIKIMS